MGFWDTEASKGRLSSGYKDFHMERLEWAALEKCIGALGDVKLGGGVGPVCLEIGCHVGFTARKLFDLIGPRSYVALDISESAIKTAKRFREEYGLGKVFFFRASASDLPIPDGVYDVCFSIRCLQNINDLQSQKKAIREIYRILKPGGHFFLVENWESSSEMLNRLRKCACLGKIDPPAHCLFLRDTELRPLLSSLFENSCEEYFASAYYFGTRFAKWLDQESTIDDLDDEYNRFFGKCGQVSFKMKLGASLGVWQKI